MNLSENISYFQSVLPLCESFDFITREITLGNTSCYFISINGMCDLEIMQRLFSDIKQEDFHENAIKNALKLPTFVKDAFYYAQISFSSSIEDMIQQVLSGPSLLLIDGYGQALIIDTRKYPARGTEEPDSEKVIRGSKDGFVETLLTNCNLLRRRLKTPGLTFSLHTVGEVSATDVAVCYLKDYCDNALLSSIKKQLDSLNTSCLTMGIQSLKELLCKKSFLHPMPNFYTTARPDVAASYLAEGYILLLVDNSPFTMVLPCNIFQFTQNPEDYYKTPALGTYLRSIRFLCIIISLFLLPLVLYFSHHQEMLPSIFKAAIPPDLNHLAAFIYILFIELGLDLFKYASSHTSSGYSSSLAIVGGLLIGDLAINLNWSNNEILFYGATTMLASLGITNVELSDAIKLYRITLILLTGFFPNVGFWIGLILIFLSFITTPVWGKKSYFWPLIPFRPKSLMKVLFRCPSYKAQPEQKHEYK